MTHDFYSWQLFYTHFPHCLALLHKLCCYDTEGAHTLRIAPNRGMLGPVKLS